MPLLAIGAATSLIGGAIGASGAKKAAAAQQAAAGQAESTLQAGSKQALDYQYQQFGQTQQNYQPYIDAGAGGLNALQYGLGTGGTANGSGVGQGSLTQAYQGFQAPTSADMQNDPGYQQRLQLGTDAIQRSAAAKGGVLTGGTAKALNTYGQDYASNEYGNVYNRALQGYQTNASNYYTGQGNTYNRLSGLANSGQQAVGSLGQLSQAASNNVSQNLLGTAQGVAQQQNNAGAAQASGYVGAANALGGAASGIGNNLSQYAGLQQLTNSGYGGGGYGGGYGGNPTPGSMSYLLQPGTGG